VTLPSLVSTSTTLGFYGVTAVTRQSTTADIKDALTAYGLLQGTSATPLNLDGGVITADGSGLTALNGSNISTGTVPNARTTAVSTNTASTIVLRDGSGNFSAGTITATLSGNATSITGNITQSQVTNLTTDLAAKAPLASPTFTGTVTLPSLVSTSTTLGFYGVTAVTRQAATTDIKDALTNYGLLQGTSASPLNLDGGALTAGAITATSITDNISTQKVRVSDTGTLIGTRREINFVDGSNVTVTAADNSGSDRVDVTVAASIKSERGATWDGGGSVLTATGSTVVLSFSTAATITGVTVICKESGSITFTVKKSTFANYPTTTDITGGNDVVVSAAQKLQNTTLTGWTTSIAAGDQVELAITGTPSTVTRATLTLHLSR
jgi:hypothetical protein